MPGIANIGIDVPVPFCPLVLKAGHELLLLLQLALPVIYPVLKLLALLLFLLQAICRICSPSLCELNERVGKACASHAHHNERPTAELDKRLKAVPARAAWVCRHELMAFSSLPTANNNLGQGQHAFFFRSCSAATLI